MLWDEENRLGAISINGYVSSYTYDASGERVSKLSGGGQGIFVNSAFSGGKTATSDFTLYTSPYLVAQSGGRYTKHIYIGSQRIVSKLGDFDSYGADPRRIEKAGDSFNGVKVDYTSKYKSALNVVKANYETLKVPYYGLDNDDYVNGLGFCCNPNPTTATTSPTGKSAASKNDNAELQQYYYHPDHLGSSSYISNLDGEVVQHVEYVPFGEVFLEEKSAVWNTPYLFNGKELDKETGLSYYGARYYDSKISVWLSVDPLVEQTMDAYGYCYQNPVNLVDPTGMAPEIERPNSYKGKLGRGDWREDDRILNTKVWRKANKYNLQQEKGYKEYNTIEQRADFYKWFQHTTESMGFETKWAGAAFVIASQMSNVHSFASHLIENDVESDVKAFAEAGNKAIFNDVFTKLKKLYNGSVLKGNQAKNWDSNTLHNEQFNIVGPIYLAQRPAVLDELSYMAKGQNTYFPFRRYSLGVPVELRFNPKGNIRMPQERYDHGMNVAVPYWNKYYSKKQ